MRTRLEWSHKTGGGAVYRCADKVGGEDVRFGEKKLVASKKVKELRGQMC